MDLNQVNAWISAAQILIAAGVSVAGKIKELIGVAHPDLTPEQLDAAYAAILADDTIRLAFGHDAAQPGA